MTVTTYSGLVTKVSKKIATVSLKRHGSGLSDVLVPSHYKVENSILSYDMGDTVNVTLNNEKILTTHKFKEKIFYVVFEKDGDELVIIDQNLVDKEDFEIDTANL